MKKIVIFFTLCIWVFPAIASDLDNEIPSLPEGDGMELPELQSEGNNQNTDETGSYVSGKKKKLTKEERESRLDSMLRGVFGNEKEGGDDTSFLDDELSKPEPKLESTNVKTPKTPKSKEIPSYKSNIVKLRTLVVLPKEPELKNVGAEEFSYTKEEYTEENSHLPKPMTNKNLGTYLITAAKRGDITGLRALLNMGRDLEGKDGFGNTPLMFAVARGHTEAVKILLASGVNPNVQNKNGTTALNIAVYDRKGEIIKYLLNKGADPNIASKFGFTSINIASRAGYNQILMSLINSHGDYKALDKEGNSPLMLASESGNSDTVKFLLGKEKSVNHKNRKGFSALHLAAKNGALTVVKELLDAGANPKLLSKNKMTPEELAIANGSFESARLIRQRIMEEEAKTDKLLRRMEDERLKQEQRVLEARNQNLLAQEKLTQEMNRKELGNQKAIDRNAYGRELQARKDYNQNLLAQEKLTQEMNRKELGNQKAIDRNAYGRELQARKDYNQNLLAQEKLTQEMNRKELGNQKAIDRNAYGRELQARKDYNQHLLAQEKITQEMNRKEPEQKKLDKMLVEWMNADKNFSSLSFGEKIMWNKKLSILREKFPEYFTAETPKEQLQLDSYMQRWDTIGIRNKNVMQKTSVQNFIETPDKQIPEPVFIGNDDVSKKTELTDDQKNELNLLAMIGDWETIDSRWENLSDEEKIELDEKRQEVLDKISTGKIIGEYAKAFSELPDKVKNEFNSSMEKWDDFMISLEDINDESFYKDEEVSSDNATETQDPFADIEMEFDAALEEPFDEAPMADDVVNSEEFPKFTEEQIIEPVKEEIPAPQPPTSVSSKAVPPPPPPSVPSKAPPQPPTSVSSKAVPPPPPPSVPSKAPPPPPPPNPSKW